MAPCLRKTPQSTGLDGLHHRAGEKTAHLWCAGDAAGEVENDYSACGDVTIGLRQTPPGVFCGETDQSGVNNLPVAMKARRLSSTRSAICWRVSTLPLPTCGSSTT